MLQAITALASGLLFGLGLVVSRMIDPAKVLGFLDIGGDWDPSLAFVMFGALAISVPGYALARRFRQPLCSERFTLPGKTAIDLHLAIGAVVFGIGWGLVGYCPGPAIASLGIGGGRTALFVAAMLVGMAGFAVFDRALQAAAPGGVSPG